MKLEITVAGQAEVFAEIDRWVRAFSLLHWQKSFREEGARLCRLSLPARREEARRAAWRRLEKAASEAVAVFADALASPLAEIATACEGLLHA